ncbi:hypothetical protein HZC35_03435 [Candidatus Saganbacteria bacterium]|nr:hypothetical protein [Candidatus Saganbacteria bacterium]
MEMVIKSAGAAAIGGTGFYLLSSIDRTTSTSPPPLKTDLTQREFEEIKVKLQTIGSAFPEDNYGLYSILKTSKVRETGLLDFKGKADETLTTLLAAKDLRPDQVQLEDLSEIFYGLPQYSASLKEMSQLKGTLCAQTALLTMLMANKVLRDDGVHSRATVLLVFVREEHIGTYCNHFIVKVPLQVEGQDRELYLDSTPLGVGVTEDPSKYIILNDQGQQDLSDYLAANGKFQVLNNAHPFSAKTIYQNADYKLVQLFTGTFTFTPNLKGLIALADTLLVDKSGKLKMINEKGYVLDLGVEPDRLLAMQELYPEGPQQFFSKLKAAGLPLTIEDASVRIGIREVIPPDINKIIEAHSLGQEARAEEIMFYLLTQLAP